MSKREKRHARERERERERKRERERERACASERERTGAREREGTRVAVPRNVRLTKASRARVHSSKGKGEIGKYTFDAPYITA